MPEQWQYVKDFALYQALRNRVSSLPNDQKNLVKKAIHDDLPEDRIFVQLRQNATTNNAQVDAISTMRASQTIFDLKQQFNALLSLYPWKDKWMSGL